MPSGTIDSTIPQTSNTVNNTPVYITGFKTAILNILGIGDNTATTQAMTISAAGAIVITVSPFTITGLATSGGASTLVITPGAHTAVTAEVKDINFAAHTMTIIDAIATQRFAFLDQPTITAASALTVTTAATFDIAGPPIPTGAGPCTITNAYGGRIEAGTLTASAATTVATAASLVVEGQPIAGTNVTITSPYGALFKDSGAKTQASTAVRIANTATSSTASIDKVGLSVTSTGTWNGTSANNVGIDFGTISGGTNNYAWRTANQCQSTLATGTAPFVIASSTKVSNLNVDQVDGADASATPTASTIPIADGSGKLDSWVTVGVSLVAAGTAGTAAANAGTAATAARSDHEHKIFSNFVRNSIFEMWETGTSSAPDWWTLAGAGAAIARESGATNFQYGIYSAKITPGAGAAATLTQRISTLCGLGVAYFAGKILTVSARVKAGAATTVRLNLVDSVGTTNGTKNTGTSWETVSVSRTINASATYIDVQVEGDANAAAFYVDGICCVESAQVPTWIPCWLDGTLIHVENLEIVAATTGSQSVTGLPRRPKFIWVMAGIGTTGGANTEGGSIGMDGGYRVAEPIMFNQETAWTGMPFRIESNDEIFWRQDAGSANGKKGAGLTFNSDGITWTNTNWGGGLNTYLRLIFFM